MLNAVNDYILVIGKDQIAVFAHQFNDQLLMAKISHFIEMFYVQMNDAFKSRLRNINNSAVLQVLSKQHAKTGCSHGAYFICLCQVNEWKRSVS